MDLFGDKKRHHRKRRKVTPKKEVEKKLLLCFLYINTVAITVPTLHIFSVCLKKYSSLLCFMIEWSVYGLSVEAFHKWCR
jgi:hypothetical protein